MDPAIARAFVIAPGIWQLRLPLPWATVHHVNAYLLDDGDRLVLVDCGIAGHPSNHEALRMALAAAGFSLGDIRLLIGTHAHSDHIGLAQWVIDESRCAFRLHPEGERLAEVLRDPAGVEAARTRRALQEGVPEDELPVYGDVREDTEGVIAVPRADATLREGDRIGPWEVIETPGHATSHVCLVDRRRSAIVLGDLVALGFVAWFDYGYSADPVAQYLASLDRIEALGHLDVGLPGHGRAIDDLPAAIAVYRDGITARVAATLTAVSQEPAGAYALSKRVFGPQPPQLAIFSVGQVAAYLRHLRCTGAVVRHEDAEGCFIYSLA